MFSLITFNAAMLDVRILKKSVYCPVKLVSLRLPHLANGLLELGADIICLQEIFHPDLQHILYNKLKKEYPYVTGFTRRGFKLRLGNELLTFSRFPVSNGNLVRFNHAAPEERIFTSKGFYHCSVQVPDIGKINLVNFHTTAGGVHTHPEHDRMDNLRMKQIEQILSYIRTLDGVILTGDLNAGPHTSRVNYQHILESGFLDTFTTSGADGFTWDPDNPLVADGDEHHLPPQKIDHIFIHQSLSELITPVVSSIVLNRQININQTQTTSLSDHYGVMTQFNKLIS